MPSQPDKNSTSPFKRFGVLNTVAVALWLILLVVIAIRTGHSPHKNSVFTTYVTGGANWLAAKDLYKGSRGFVYSPVTAAFFAPFSLLPSFLGNTLWRLLNAAILLGGVFWWLKAGLHRWIPENRHALVFILLLPLSIGNFNNGQVNPLIIGLLLIAIVAAYRDRFTLAAFCIAAATYFKIYPLAIGLLLMLVYPRKFAWRLIAALLLVGGVSLLLQRPSYVLDQYRLWWETRSSDNRLEYGSDIAPRDLWMLLRLAHITISQHAYMAIQLLSGAAIGLVCLFGRYKQWPKERVLIALFLLGCSWMLLCGPASESATYIMLAPAVVISLIHAFSRPIPLAMLSLISISFAVLIVGLIMNSFMHLKKTTETMSVQPMAALIFLAYSVALIASSKVWKPMEVDPLDSQPQHVTCT